MVKGRPIKSKIRQNIVEILHYLGEGYGYQVAKMYNEIFPSVTQRSVYYNLQKGILTKEISVHKIEEEKGDFSWGSMVEKKYYSLGKNAEPKGEKRVKEYLSTWKKERSPSRFTSFVDRWKSWR
ncbi:MAG: hypothetical protein Q8R47_04795 [Nanoarchaeota archaeon]|nr:hypothetical protein [Nanoarchaeota archaeon]